MTTNKNKAYKANICVKWSCHTPFNESYLMNYHYLSMFERVHTETLHILGYSTQQFAIQMGWHHFDIACELIRNVTEDAYLVESAHKSYENRRIHSKPHGKYDKTIADIIEEELGLIWSSG